MDILYLYDLNPKRYLNLMTLRAGPGHGEQRAAFLRILGPRICHRCGNAIAAEQEHKSHCKFCGEPVTRAD